MNRGKQKNAENVLGLVLKSEFFMNLCMNKKFDVSTIQTWKNKKTKSLYKLAFPSSQYVLISPLIITTNDFLTEKN